jgi:hypothetical protein
VLYNFRHQLASDLKSINMSNKKRSYIMVHQNTVSIGRYGSSRSGTGACSIRAGGSQDQINAVRKTGVSDYFDKKLNSQNTNTLHKQV